MTDIDKMRGVLSYYGMTLNDEGFFILSDGKTISKLKAMRVKHRVQVRYAEKNVLYFSGPFPQGLANFVETFWYKERIK